MTLHALLVDRREQRQRAVLPTRQIMPTILARESLKAFLLLLAVLIHADAQTYDVATIKPSLKLTGVAIKATPEGYLVVSVPTKDIPKVIHLAEMLIPHYGVWVAMEPIAGAAIKSGRVVTVIGKPEVPSGLVFLTPTQIFTRRLKVIDRFVQPMGTHDYITSRGTELRLAAYAGGPMVR